LLERYLPLIREHKYVEEGQGEVEDQVDHQVLPHQLINAAPPPEQQLPEHPQPITGGNLSCVGDCHSEVSTFPEVAVWPNQFNLSVSLALIALGSA